MWDFGVQRKIFFILIIHDNFYCLNMFRLEDIGENIIIKLTPYRCRNLLYAKLFCLFKWLYQFNRNLKFRSLEWLFLLRSVTLCSENWTKHLHLRETRLVFSFLFLFFVLFLFLFFLFAILLQRGKWNVTTMIWKQENFFFFFFLGLLLLSLFHLIINYYVWVVITSGLLAFWSHPPY